MRNMLDFNLRKTMGKKAFSKATKSLNLNKYGQSLFNLHNTLLGN